MMCCKYCNGLMIKNQSLKVWIVFADNYFLITVFYKSSSSDDWRVNSGRDMWASCRVNYLNFMQKSMEKHKMVQKFILKNSPQNNCVFNILKFQCTWVLRDYVQWVIQIALECLAVDRLWQIPRAGTPVSGTGRKTESTDQINDSTGAGL